MEEGWRTSGLAMGPGIPAPTGQYRVGCVDLMHQLEGDDKGLLVRLHYPTAATPEKGYQYGKCETHRKYFDAVVENFQKMPALEQDASTPEEEIPEWSSPEMPALEGAPLLTDGPSSFPVIAFSHGFSGMRSNNCAIFCDIASHGFVVASVEHRDGSAMASLQRVPKPGGKEGEFEDSWLEFQDYPPGGDPAEEFAFRNKQVKIRADDVKKTLNILTLLNEGAEVRNMMEGSYDFQQFKGHLDVSTVAVMGHSFGGASTIQTLAEDKRFKCGLALDPWLMPVAEEDSAKVTQPLYFINSYDFQWKDNVKRMLRMSKPPDADGRTPCRVLTLDGSHHCNQSDAPFTSPTILTEVLKIEESRVDNETLHKTNQDICLNFLKRYLLKDPAYQRPIPNLDGTEGHSEHIIFGTNVDLSDANQKGFTGWKNN